MQYAKEGSVIGISTIDGMKQELMANGPISSQFKVRNTDAIYKHTRTHAHMCARACTRIHMLLLWCTHTNMSRGF